MSIRFNGKFLINGDLQLKLPAVIRDAFEDRTRIVVLLDYFGELTGSVTEITEVRNLIKGSGLICVDASGLLLWEAELPNSGVLDDYYYRITSRDPLTVNSFSSFSCRIDVSTGKIINQRFYK